MHRKRAARSRRNPAGCSRLEANTSTVTQDIPRILLNPKGRHRVHNRSSLVLS